MSDHRIPGLIERVVFIENENAILKRGLAILAIKLGITKDFITGNRQAIDQAVDAINKAIES